MEMEDNGAFAKRGRLYLRNGAMARERERERNKERESRDRVSRAEDSKTQAGRGTGRADERRAKEIACACAHIIKIDQRQILHMSIVSRASQERGKLASGARRGARSRMPRNGRNLEMIVAQEEEEEACPVLVLAAGGDRVKASERRCVGGQHEKKKKKGQRRGMGRSLGRCLN